MTDGLVGGSRRHFSRLGRLVCGVAAVIAVLAGGVVVATAQITTNPAPGANPPLEAECGLKVMLGCMVESELGIAAAAQIASLVDYVDLDGHLLISNSPFSGLGFRDGGVVASADPGLGVKPA